jgi:predicted nuclease of restriction endonuclease-like (RecB) superfamily
LANREQLALYYSVGRYVSDNSRVGKWGSKAIDAISNQLQGELPGLRGFSATNIRYMRLFYENWAPILEPIHQLTTDGLVESDAVTVIHQLATDELGLLLTALPVENLIAADAEAFIRVGFTHHQTILSQCKDINERWYYIRRCASEYWKVYELKDHIKVNDYKRYGALPNNFALTIPDAEHARRAVYSFKDEYFLDFVNIDEDDYDLETLDERVLEREIIANIRKFIMTCGSGFCYISHQYRIIVADDEFVLDLLFYNRDLNRLVVFELKRGKFKPAYLGQLTFYLSSLDREERRAHEEKTIGILLCQEMNKGVVELAVQDYNKPIGVALYKTPNDIPEEYQSLKPLIEGVQEILTNDAEEKKEQ